MDNNSSSEETLDNICEEPGGSKCCSDKEDEADVIDNSEIEEAKEKVDFLLKKERSLEMQLERQVQLTQQLQNQNEFLSQTVEILKEQLRNTPNVVKASSSDSVNRTLRLFLKNTVKVASDNSCRVMAYNPFIACLFVSCKSQPFFSGFSVVKLDVQSGKPVGSIACHSGPVRDVRICPDGYATFLTCSMDRNLKLCDSRNMQTAQSIYVGEPVWNCCWNASHSQFVYVGTQAGKVRMYDLRMICNQQGNEPLRDISNMQKPVVSLHWKHHPSRPERYVFFYCMTIQLWDMNTNRKCCQSDNAVCSSDDVVFDMCTTTLPNEAVLFALTRSNVLFYRII
ncbi:conserved hypothetical protein [Trichinella spiralis]|uniref:hypothetical protein n=1 Tax=Trichinella spiralis TaxID=6334 RepID=UPI0001EFE78F|nr:conserved hypothetical protein [Trichinella spiralis]